MMNVSFGPCHAHLTGAPTSDNDAEVRAAVEGRARHPHLRADTVRKVSTELSREIAAATRGCHLVRLSALRE